MKQYNLIQDFKINKVDFENCKLEFWFRPITPVEEINFIYTYE